MSTTVPQKPLGPEEQNRTHHSLFQKQSHLHNQHHGVIMPSKSIFIIIIFTISLVLLLAIFLILLMLRRFKSSKNKEDIYKDNDSPKNTSNKFISQTAINFTPSPGN